MKWLDRSLITSPYYYGLCASVREFERELKRLRIPRKMRPEFLPSESANAAVHFFDSNGGSLTCIVTLGSTNGKKRTQIHALLVHEAVHIWQAIRDYMGEKNPSSEFEAYTIQTISQRLIEAYEAIRK